VSKFFDDEEAVQEQDNFYEQAEPSQSLYTYKANRASEKQLSNICRIKYTTAENSV
jgi:hypothetical protein